MEIHLNNKLDPLQIALPRKSRAAEQIRVSDSAMFDEMQKLQEALATTPEVRADAVQRARDLIGDVKYPPSEIIQRISELLALELDSTAQPGSARQ